LTNYVICVHGSSLHYNEQIISNKIKIVCVCRAQAPCSSDLLQRYAGRDATQPFYAAAHSQAAKEMMQGFLVGYYMEPEQEVVQVLFSYLTSLF
jgi:hypothetical protein